MTTATWTIDTVTPSGKSIVKFAIEKPVMIVGRVESADLTVPKGDVSRAHAELSKSAEQLKVRDLGSTNGTFVNDRKVESQALHHQDVIRVGWNHFTFVDESQQDIEKTAEIKKSWVPGVYYTKD